MKAGNYKISIQKRISISGGEATFISVLAILLALLLFSLIFVLADKSPLTAYREIFSYAFFNPFGLPATINRFIFLLLVTYAFIIPFRAGLWNIGMAGQLYAGALGAFAVLYVLGAKSSAGVQLSPPVVIALMMVAAAVGGAIVGLIAGYLKGKFNLNEIVVTMMLNFITFWVVSFMIKDGGIFMNRGGRGESFELPTAVRAPLIADMPITIILALGLAILLYFVFAKTKVGYEIKTYGLNPNAARYAGISSLKIPLLVFVLGGIIAGLAGYHYFGAVPGVYKIARNYGFFGDLSFYGIICGLISLGDPLAAIPVAFLFGGLSVGGRFIQGKLGMSFGVDYALLGVLMITLVAFQFFYRYKIVWQKIEEEQTHVGVFR